MNSDRERVTEIRAASLREKYGELLSLVEVAEVLRFNTVGALRKAHSRGTLPVELKRFPNRRGWFATPEAIAKCIDEMESSAKDGV